LLHDAFKGLKYWDSFMTGGDSVWPGVAMDIHIYQMFSNDQVALSDDQHISLACSQGSALSSFHLWTIVGEWTPAATDCAKYLNGRGRGARYDGTFNSAPYAGACSAKTGSGANFSPNYKTFLRKYWEAQTITFEKGAGWIQWTWKAEQADDWSYQAGLKYGWIPQNPADRQYPQICG
jgi:aryl-phospho-beta-D-glucosidase BglC (GH1 family)